MESILKVVTSASDFALVDLDTLKEELEITSTNDDEWLTDKIGRVSQSIAKYCRRVFAVQSYAETFRRIECGRPVQSLSLFQYPLTSTGITKITADVTELTTLQFEANTDSAILYRLTGSCRTPWCNQTVMVEYQAGYSDVPGDLQDATITAMKAAISKRSRDPSMRAQSQPGLGEQQYWVGNIPGQEGALPQEIMPLLDEYRKRTIA